MGTDLSTTAGTAAIELGIKIAHEAIQTGSAVLRMRRETVEFLTRAESLRDLVHTDMEAAARTIQPMLSILLESENLGTEERLALIAAVRAISEIGAHSRGHAIRELSKKI